MDFDSAKLLEILFEEQEDRDPRDPLAAANAGLSFLLQDHPYGCLSDEPGSCPASQLQSLADPNPADFLQLRVDPNDVYNPRSPSASTESDSGLSDSPCRAPLPPDRSPPIVLEVLCDTGTWEDTVPHLVPTTALENGSPPGTDPSTCIPSQASLGFLEAMTEINPTGVPTDQEKGADPLPLSPLISFRSEQLRHPGLLLTDEERRLLRQEGVLLRDALHLSQAEERILKKIRRKIRNKQSAQDSRRRKKEYLDGLESRVAACSAQNQDLKKKVQQLENHKESLLDQLQKLQGLLKQTSAKAVQTSTCLVILLVSFGLFIWPSCASLFGGSQVGREDHAPSGVLSRNILTQKGAAEPASPSAARHPEVPHVRTALPPELHATSVGEDEAEKNLPVEEETALEEASEPQRDLQTPPKGRWRGKAPRPDLDEI
ncbi:cyclic AMP-responsive element-binding protein 3-like protein 4 isoform X2 [Python bivittatus]|uniref:Cyclic AMP-responsive element-binding protein 3-like protein 4 n=1 Tax=Python bivittatus TaxID=176946 RepID=A0A9F5J1F6_PYTBI|nr:cyclic AMP-responsive element-binding protein 3-like protein 4 isoform X2 [Python bivittatus]XP_025022982.1 cyclic AMP-responsive element-binding protein 3-like protein 4 isoform X2 [Python bivittatus]XP_025022983.1 cyclic AMP-responsive element-binding protein 3-like protein 4 isoform X2 [Python bivittatus]